MTSNDKTLRARKPDGEFAPLFGWFDEIRLINVTDRTDRLRDSMEELERAGLDPERHPFTLYAATRFADAGGFPTLGARGSFTSHREVLREARDAGKRSVLVFEDDIRVLGAPAEAVRKIVDQLDEEPWDLVYFGLLRPELTSLPYRLEPYDGPTTGGHFYGIREPYLSAMLDFMDACERRPPGSPEGGPMFRDGAYNHYREYVGPVRILAATPNLGGQRSSRTDLHDLRFWDRAPVLREGVTLLRSIVNRLRR